MICAVYARVSTEEQAKGDSISHQVEFFKEYARNNNYHIARIYIDEGVSGTKSEGRDAFIRLTRDALEKKFNIVLIKSISRLARNLRLAINTVYEFVENDIRLISIEDNIDTIREDSKILLGIHATLAEQESERISQRVKFGLRQKAKNGYYTGSYPPYGYKRKDKNSIEPANDYTTVVAKRIFDMYIAGKGMRRIAGILNEEGIPCPAISRGLRVDNPRWTDRGVRVILTNPVYAGCLEQCKTTTKSAVSGRRIINSQTVFVENTHQGIITAEQYNTVKQIMRQRRINRTGSKKHLFTRVLFCKTCGNTMFYRAKGYICSGYIKQGKEFCTSHWVREESILAAIKKDLSFILRDAVDTSQILFELKRRTDAENLGGIKTSIKLTETQIDELNIMLKNLLALYSNNAIVEQQFMEQISDIKARYLQLKKILASLNQQYQEMCNIPIDITVGINDFLSLKDVSPQIIAKLIDKISVDDDKCLEIYYNFTV